MIVNQHHRKPWVRVSASFRKERIDENHPWVTDDGKSGAYSENASRGGSQRVHFLGKGQIIPR